MDLYMRYDQPLHDEELGALRELMKRAATKEPVEYITGELEFFGALFKTDQRALIPRVETELLVEYVARGLKGNETVLDLCTGSGCIGISLKRKFPNLTVYLSDLSEDALNLARENAKDVAVEILHGDFLTPFAGKKADVIVCNPPYVTEKEYLEIDASVRDFEPKMALVGGADGLEFYKKLASAHEALTPHGKLFLEIGCNQGNQLQKIFQSPFWTNGKLIQDLAGRDRFFSLEKQ